MPQARVIWADLRSKCEERNGFFSQNSPLGPDPSLPWQRSSWRIRNLNRKGDRESESRRNRRGVIAGPKRDRRGGPKRNRDVHRNDLQSKTTSTVTASADVPTMIFMFGPLVRSSFQSISSCHRKGIVICYTTWEEINISMKVSRMRFCVKRTLGPETI